MVEKYTHSTELDAAMTSELIIPLMTGVEPLNRFFIFLTR